MKNFDKKLTKCLQQDPPYECLDQLRSNVWGQIRKKSDNKEEQAWFNLSLTPAVKVFSFVLILGSCLALSQITFNKNLEPDLFDLRYFSHQSLATTNLLSVNIQGSFP